MSPAAAKLLMCTCAGTLGAVSVPAYHKAKTGLRPRPAVARQVSTAAAVPCLPFGSGQAVSMGAGGFPEAAAAAAAPVTGAITGLAAAQPVSGGTWPASSRLAGPGGRPAPLFSAPPASPAPEPESWALLIVGLGAVGGGLRRQRVQPAG